MRKMLLSLAVIGGVSATAAVAHAAPAVTAPVVKAAPLGQTVQYYDPDWREREHMRHRREEEWRRREAWRDREAWRERHLGVPPAVVYGAPPPVIVRPY